MIKKIFPISIVLVLAIALCSFSHKKNTISDAVNWMTIEEAVNAQDDDPRPIMIDVYTKWCGPCKMMSSNTFGDARVAAYLNEHFYCVKFDAESEAPVFFGGKEYKNPDFKPNTPGRNGVHEFARFLNVSAYPTLFFMDKKAQGLGPVTGYRTPAQIELFLHYFSEEKYLTVRTQEEFQEYEKNFVTTWN
jgi:thioredoxin-related protein